MKEGESRHLANKALANFVRTKDVYKEMEGVKSRKKTNPRCLAGIKFVFKLNLNA